ncbi:outer membrane beta-barrel protein [Pontiella sulfatireligans]|uniref:Outer membrane protein beta-barrel domain-containing protein n=1 Tax=Pontiella sulfatireligans TaxID=2750658 RepID=A0A6C2UM47_9BACT|nr:outer membrane beta-barrel protein [Pontiella sulfatireligans]VGO21342.1 hypothetical protein SCARR_03414 [Pontiella sulfatireligans]
MRRLTPALVAVILLSSSAPLFAQGLHEYDEWYENYTVQALLGAMKFDDLKIDVEGSGTQEKADLSTVPQVGGAWGTLPLGNRIQVGLEATFLVGWRTDNIEYIEINSGLRARVSTSMWMFDLAGGPYINLFLDEGKRVRVYGAAGPLLMYANYDADKDYDGDNSYDENDDSESAFGFGAYGRAGIEFRIHERGMLGMGARILYANLDLSDVGGTTDVKGIAGFVTYTAGF